MARPPLDPTGRTRRFSRPRNSPPPVQPDTGGDGRLSPADLQREIETRALAFINARIAAGDHRMVVSERKVRQAIRLSVTRLYRTKRLFYRGATLTVSAVTAAVCTIQAGAVALLSSF